MQWSFVRAGDFQEILLGGYETHAACVGIQRSLQSVQVVTISTDDMLYHKDIVRIARGRRLSP
jgi:hypothetical protein